MKFDLVLTNPPFQDRQNRGKTPHKLWIDFTKSTFSQLLADGGMLCQVSPSSFRSPSNKILTLMKGHPTAWIDLDTDRYFPDVGSTFANYGIWKAPRGSQKTKIIDPGGTSEVLLDEDLFYLPTDLSAESVSIHRKVIFESTPKLEVRHDYVTCHNIILRKGKTLSKEQSKKHKYPVFHTNRQTWWSSIRQDFAGERKVMWTRSGYTKPFYDPGELGGTDMAYFVLVPTEEAGRALAHNLSLKLMSYIFETAKWSGFGNERVFEALPQVPTDKELSDEELYAFFDLTSEEVAYVERRVG